MDMSSILEQAAVRVIGSASSKKRLFQEIGSVAQSVYGLNQHEVIDALNERETLGPTGVGHGVALPHARLDTLDKVCMVFLLLEKPMNFESVDRQPVDLVVALFAPSDAGVEHLKALAMVSRTLRDRSVRDKLRANADAATLFAILTETQSEQAA